MARMHHGGLPTAAFHGPSPLQYNFDTGNLNFLPIGDPVGKFPAIFIFYPTTHKIKQQKEPEKQDQPWTDHSTISAKPH